ncbi:MAG: hypothetical protein NXI31_00945 [bacterium]|nr:hypothetical protein [bacterium]
MKRLLGISCLVAAGWLALVPPPQLVLYARFTAAEIEQVTAMSLSRTPIPAATTNAVATDFDAAEFGRKLFFDPRLSGTGEIACADCHRPESGFADGLEVAQGTERGRRNTPGLWNVAFGRWWNWDGSADSLWAQAMGPLESPAEMAGSRTAIARLLRDDQILRGQYERVFGRMPDLHELLPIDDERTREAAETVEPTLRANVTRIATNAAKAIAAYERTLVARSSPFDRFADGLARGDQTAVDALSASAQRGLKTFLTKGRCVLCHHGPTFTDGEFHNLGLPSRDSDADLGRYAGVQALKASEYHASGTYSDDRTGQAAARLRFVTQRFNNVGEFKTPTLRNLPATAPYMHDGRFVTLAEVVRFYSDLPAAGPLGHREESLLPARLDEGEQRDLVAFLRSLHDPKAVALKR